jgi:Domain of unknown function (DUF4062)
VDVKCHDVIERGERTLSSGWRSESSRSEEPVAKPRVFLSSTFYDLKQVRADIKAFIFSLGYEPVLNDSGSIAYGTEEKLEQYCYREVGVADILVSVIGGRYGSPSQYQPYSVSQMELKTALKHGKQVYIFVEKPVLIEYRTYKRNKTVKDITYDSVDSVKVFEFLDEINQLERNNTTAGFETSQDITDYLKEQWAGLFQRFLQEQLRAREMNAIQNLETTAQTLNQLVKFLTDERRGTSNVIQDILLTSHPIFSALSKLLSVSYRIFFANLKELNRWLLARSFTPVEEQGWDTPEFRKWIKTVSGKVHLLKIRRELFDEADKLRIYTESDWNDEWVTLDISDVPSPRATEISDDDIPF